jgi:gas vesicle protein
MWVQNRSDIMTVQEAFKYAGIALVAGGIGGVLGVLLAPASGRETRRMVRRRMDEAREDVVRSGERLVERVEDEIKEVRRSIA